MTHLGLEPDRPRRDDGLARYGALGLQFAASVGLLAWGGFWLDGRLGTSPWFLMAGASLGFAGSILAIIRAVPPPRPPKSPSSPPNPRTPGSPGSLGAPAIGSLDAGPSGREADRLEPDRRTDRTQPP
jgi:hypothetical protein